MEAKIDLLDKIRQVIEDSKTAKAKKIEARKNILAERKLNSAKASGLVIAHGSKKLVAILPTGMTAAKFAKTTEKFSEKIEEFKNSENSKFLKL